MYLIVKINKKKKRKMYICIRGRWLEFGRQQLLYYGRRDAPKLPKSLRVFILDPRQKTSRNKKYMYHYGACIDDKMCSERVFTDRKFTARPYSPERKLFLIQLVLVSYGILRKRV